MAIDIKAVLTAVDYTGPAFKSAQDGMDKLATVARRATIAISGIFSARNLGNMADEYANIQARLQLATRSAQEFEAANAAIERIARAAQAPLAETATLYVRIASGLKDAGVAQSAYDSTVEATALALRISGASAAESASAMLQFSQAVASGVLRGEEFNALSESAPRMMQALAAALGKPTGALREMAKEGKLTREVLIEALAKELPTLQKEAESLPQTIGSAFTALQNEILLTVGEIDKATGVSSKFAETLLEMKPMILVVFQTLSILGANVAFVFTTIWNDLRGILAAAYAILRLDFKSAVGIIKMTGDDARQARAELDALEKRIMAVGKKRDEKPLPPGDVATTRTSPLLQPDKAALAAARRESEALKKAQEALRKAREEAEAQGLADGIEARRAALEAARKQELIDGATFIRAKAALDEEGLRNELAALQRQQAALRAAATDPRAKGSERTNALAELATVEARIQSAQGKILNLNIAAAADLAELEVRRLAAQTDFIEGLEQEAFLAGLSNEAREQALLLLEAEKLGIKDVNRLLELQAGIRDANAAKQRAEEIARQQDALYNSVQEGVQRAFADGLNAVATGEGGIRGALKNAVDAIRNALSNAIAGSLTESFLGMLGGKQGVLSIAGTLGLGGKNDGSSAANAVWTRDASAATGGAVAGQATGGLFEQIRSVFSQLGEALSSIFSRISSAVSGLFSGGGGGGGFLSAIGSLFGFADGGYTGPGGKYQPRGIVHAGEYVNTQKAVRTFGVNFFNNLEAIASGRFIPRGPRLNYADGGLVNLPQQAAPTVNSSTRIVNLFDPAQVAGQLGQTREFERAVLNIIQLNPSVLR
mgnify:CR=1 FL=1